MGSDRLRVTLLGTGSSGGVPRIGGDWGACDPTHPRNRRRRCSILVTRGDARRGEGETQVLVDTAPDLREQLLDAGVGSLDAVLYTHDHADQMHGIDDLRVVAMTSRKRVAVYADPPSSETLLTRFRYCFVQPPGSWYPPILTLHPLPRRLTITGAGGPISVDAIQQDHGSVMSWGFRFGAIGYSNDVVTLDDAAFAALAGVDTWIVDALRWRPHPTHAHVARALEWIERLAPRRAVLTNMHVDLDYETLRRVLPPGVEPGYDGMVLEVPA